MEGFEQLTNQYQPMIYKIINSLHIYKNVEEFYQTGLIALWDAQKNFNGEKGKFTSFAYSWIKGRILNEMTKESKQAERFVYPEDEYWEMIPDDYDNLSLEKEFLQTYGRTLNEKETKWLTLACFTGLSLNEIAAREHITVSAVKQWRSSARKKLREQLKALQ